MTTTALSAHERTVLRLGFHPQDSLVLACTAGARENVTIRVDLDPLTDPTVRTDMLHRLRGPLIVSRSDSTTVLYYTEDSPRRLAPVDRDLSDLLTDLHITRTATVLIDTVDELAPTREDLAVIAPAPTSVRREVLSVLTTPPSVVDLQVYLSALTLARIDWPIPGRELAHIAIGLRTTRWRDSVGLLIAGMSDDTAASYARGSEQTTAVTTALRRLFDRTHARRPGPELHAHLRVLTEVIAATPTSYHAPPRALLALSTWWAGNTALAARHTEYSLEADPDYSLAHLINDALDLGAAPPWTTTP